MLSQGVIKPTKHNESKQEENESKTYLQRRIPETISKITKAQLKSKLNLRWIKSFQLKIEKINNLTLETRLKLT